MASAGDFTIDIDVISNVDEQIKPLQDRLDALTPFDLEDTLVCYDDDRVVRLACPYNPLTRVLTVPIKKKGVVTEVIVRTDTTLGVSALVHLPLNSPLRVRKGDTIHVTVER